MDMWPFTKPLPVAPSPNLSEWRESYLKIRQELIKREPVTNYNDLVPPSNPEYPWKGDGWQMLCYYCSQPIFYESVGKLSAGYRQRGPLNMS